MKTLKMKDIDQLNRWIDGKTTLSSERVLMLLDSALNGQMEVPLHPFQMITLIKLAQIGPHGWESCGLKIRKQKQPEKGGSYTAK